MAATTTPARAARFAADVARRLDAAAGDSDRMTTETRSKLSVIVRALGVRRRTAGTLAALDTALIERGIYYEPDLTDARLPLDTGIRFSYHPPAPSDPDRVLFPTEYALETFIAGNLSKLFSTLELVKTQFEVPSGLIDILARDRISKDLVVIELKKARADRGVVVQTMAYVEEVRASPKTEGVGVRAMIVSGVEDERLHRYAFDLARAHDVPIEWVIYDVAMSFTRDNGHQTISPYGGPEESDVRDGFGAMWAADEATMAENERWLAETSARLHSEDTAKKRPRKS